MQGNTIVAAEHRCPERKQVLELAGDMPIGGGRLPVYRCPSCIEDGELFGMPFEVSVMFAVLPSGDLVRPGDWRG